MSNCFYFKIFCCSFLHNIQEAFNCIGYTTDAQIVLLTINTRIAPEASAELNEVISA